jgi:hypothetical protein
MYMGVPKGFPKGFDFAGCVNVTIVLKDFQVLTGRIKGFSDNERFGFGYDNDYKDCPKHDKCKHDDKCGKPPKVDVDVKVDVEEECKFILLELTRPVAAANLSSVACTIIGEIILGLGLVISGTTFPEGTCVAVNVENILYIGTGASFCDFPISIGAVEAGGPLTVTLSR